MAKLYKSYCVEILDGKVLSLFKRGCEIPAYIAQNLSSTHDNEHFFVLHVLRGDADLARDNETYARYVIRHVPEAPKGTARVDVRFEVDFDGSLKVTAFDMNTGSKLPVTALA